MLVPVILEERPAHRRPAREHVRELQQQLARRCVLGRARSYDRSARTRPAREAFLKRFEREVDPNNELSPDEGRRRAEHAKRVSCSALRNAPQPHAGEIRRLKAIRAALTHAGDPVLARRCNSKPSCPCGLLALLRL